jgi:hypothetical protein
MPSVFDDENAVSGDPRGGVINSGRLTRPLVTIFRCRLCIVRFKSQLKMVRSFKPYLDQRNKISTAQHINALALQSQGNLHNRSAH